MLVDWGGSISLSSIPGAEVKTQYGWEKNKKNTTNPIASATRGKDKNVESMLMLYS